MEAEKEKNVIYGTKWAEPTTPQDAVQEPCDSVGGEGRG